MVAKIISGKSLIGALNYNENKVKAGKAELIGESGYAKNLDMLMFNDKLLRLTDLVAGNDRVKTNTVHISLNFAPGERLDKNVLMEITGKYMEGIGFGNQPYLVYQHQDAGHPHIHIVSTNIKFSGERISLHNLGRTKSEDARKAIELEYSLIQATQQEKFQKHERQQLSKAEYGKADTKRTITNIVNEIIRSYKFTSLPELNAILNHYNVTADRGSKESRMYAKNGLVYWLTDDRKEKLGVPIKASSIYGKPTLKMLSEYFRINDTLRKPHKERVKQAIDSVLLTKASKAGFQKALQDKGIQVVFRHNEQGQLYGVTFVDQQLKVVFNGSDLGKAYCAAALACRFINPKSDQVKSEVQFKVPAIRPVNIIEINDFTAPAILNDLLKTEYEEINALPGMTQKKRKKRRRRLS